MWLASVPATSSVVGIVFLKLYLKLLWFRIKDHASKRTEVHVMVHVKGRRGKWGVCFHLDKRKAHVKDGLELRIEQ